MSAQYYCSFCRKPTEAVLTNVGASARCCFEAALMVIFCPSYPDRCDGCEMRPLTAREEEELRGELYQEQHADDTPAMRSRNRVMDGE